MDKLKAILEVTRPRNMAISFLGVITGILLVSLTNTIDFNAITAALSAMLILAGGNALNDYYDLPTDKVNRPNRPIPSGRIGRSFVRVLSTLLFLAGITLAFSINVYCLSLALVNTIILAGYAKYSKKAFLLSNVAISYLTASVFIYGALSIYKTMNFNPMGVDILLILAGSSFFMTLSREIIKDMEDIAGDSKIAAKTLPTVVGEVTSKKIAITAGAMAVLISLLPFIEEAVRFNTTAYALFIIPANLIFISSYLKKAGKNQKLLVLGMTISLMAFLAGRLMA